MAVFFTPTIRTLIEGGARVHVLCLSVGQQARGLRPRSEELRTAAAMLGIDDVEVVDSPDLQDGMQTVWSPEAVETAIAASIRRRPADIVVTFDSGGVSGHLNHVCTHAGVVQFAARSDSPPCYELETVSILRKFSSVIDIVTSWAAHLLRGGSVGDNPRRVFLAYPGLALVHRAMAHGHASQYVWFRWLYVAFSRYAVANTLTRMN